MRFRLAKGIAITGIALMFGWIAPTVAAQASPLAISAIANATSTTPTPGGAGDGQRRPNVGDDAPGGHKIGEQHNIFNDDGGLVALGLAVLIGAAMAILVMRSRRKSSLY
jgi:hypothetical protein